MKSLSIVIASIITFIVVVAANIFIGGYTVATLWGWFIIPLSQSIPTISIAHGAGFALFMQMFNNIDAEEDKQFMEIIIEGFFKTVIKCSVTLGLGYIIVTQFM